MRANRAIARRQYAARWGKRLFIPTFAGMFVLGRASEWLGIACAVLLVVEACAVMLDEAQRCPRCDASLVSGRAWFQEFTPTCPQCGCPID